MISRPPTGEYPAYFQPYLDLIKARDILTFLDQQNIEFGGLLSTVTPEKGAYRYAPGKWSIKEVLGHVTDIERAMAYRAFSFSREEKAPLPGIDQDLYTPLGSFDNRELPDLIEEFTFLRLSNLRLFSSFSDEVSRRTGQADGKNFSVRALVYIAAGHAEHHIAVLKERYLGR